MGTDPKLRINRRIRAREVRLVDHEGNQVGIVPFFDALKKAEEHGLDLVEVAPNARPPVCKILDYGKYRYQITKKQTTKHKAGSVKEVKVRPQINKHDLDFKVRNIKKFLKEGNKVKVSMFFRGREIVYSANAKGVFEKVCNELEGTANIERMAKLEGRQMIMILAPK